MYDIYIGKQQSIVFPIMCNAHISIGYADNVPDIENTASDTTDDIPYGIWSHTGSFTFEAIVTPYDINGTGEKGLRGRSAIQTSQYVMPQGTSGKISEAYLPVADRYGHEMCIFHNDNFRLTLVNSTTTNNNQPAEYKLKAYVTINGVQETFESPVIISSSSSKSWSFGDSHVKNNFSGFTANGRLEYDSIAEVTTTYLIGSSIAVNTTNHGSRAITDIFYQGQKVYVRRDLEFVEVGTVSSASSTSITLNSAYTGSALPLVSGEDIYTETFKEPKYAENMHHVAVVFNATKNSITMFYNRQPVFNGVHTETSDFSFARTDCILGKNTTSDNDASTDMQYMGEIHELSIEKGAKKSILYTNTLFPFYDETLLYLRFEEVDL